MCAGSMSFEVLRPLSGLVKQAFKQTPMTSSVLAPSGASLIMSDMVREVFHSGPSTAVPGPLCLVLMRRMHLETRLHVTALPTACRGLRLVSNEDGASETVPLILLCLQGPGEGMPQKRLGTAPVPNTGSRNMTDAVPSASVSLSRWQG